MLDTGAPLEFLAPANETPAVPARGKNNVVERSLSIRHAIQKAAKLLLHRPVGNASPIEPLVELGQLCQPECGQNVIEAQVRADIAVQVGAPPIGIAMVDVADRDVALSSGA